MPEAPREATVDWSAIERSEDFRELTKGRRRFSVLAGALGMGAGLLYIVLAGVAPDLMGTQLIGSISLGFLGGMLLIVLTWAITITYMRRSTAVWQPLEERIRAQATESSAAGPRSAEDPR